MLGWLEPSSDDLAASFSPPQPSLCLYRLRAFFGGAVFSLDLDLNIDLFWPRTRPEGRLLDCWGPAILAGKFTLNSGDEAPGRSSWLGAGLEGLGAGTKGLGFGFTGTRAGSSSIYLGWTAGSSLSLCLFLKKVLTGLCTGGGGGEAAEGGGEEAGSVLEAGEEGQGEEREGISASQAANRSAEEVIRGTCTRRGLEEG